MRRNDSRFRSSCRRRIAGWRLTRCRRRAISRRREAAGLQPRRLRRRARRRRPARGEGPVARAGGRLGRDARVPPPSLGARFRRRRGDGHRAARDGARLADLARARSGARSTPRATSRARSSRAAPAPTISRRVRSVTVDDVIAAYEQQFAAVERAGGRIIMMASRALAACASSPDDYSPRLLEAARAGEGAGHHPLAGRDVRSRARRLLGQRRSLPGDGRGTRW